MGGFLASFDSADELTALSKHLAISYPTDRWWWISGSDLDTFHEWYWYRSGERINYTDWATGQPDNNGGNEHCVNLWYNGKKFQMNDWKCYQKTFFICEADKPKRFDMSLF